MLRCKEVLKASLVTITLFQSHYSYSIDSEKRVIPLNEDNVLVLAGGYRVEAGTFGSSRLAYTPGPMAVSDDDKLLFVSGHVHHYSVGSFMLESKPSIGPIKSLPIASNYQPFVKISPNIKRNTANRITGLDINDSKLFVTTDEFYDANTDNREHLVIFESPDSLNSSDQNGYFELGARSHASGWMGEIPETVSTLFGFPKDYNLNRLAGSASNLAINGRLSIGPSLFTWFPYFIPKAEAGSRPLSTVPLIDYSLENPLHKDQYNEEGNNDIWTELSTAVYGFFTPDGSSYIVIGTSGGHQSGIGYKIEQSNGKRCGGPCAFDHTDYYNYYWIYDTQDIKKVYDGELKAHEIRPSNYGELPIFDHRNLIIGADFNSSSRLLYLLIDRLDKTQSRFESQPVLMVYELKKLCDFEE